jgi:hypothetical protein
MNLSLNHIRHLRLPLTALVLSALFVWFITPNVRGNDNSNAYFNQGGDQIVLVLDAFKRNAPIQSVAKEYTSETTDNIGLETACASVHCPALIGTLVLKVLYSTIEINAP